MKIFFMNSMMIFNFIFIQLNHPMSMGMIILIQILIAIVMMNIYMKLPWFSYMILLMFVGGMLILFMYMCSISSNNIMIISPKMIMMISSLTSLNFFLSVLMNNNLMLNSSWINSINLFNNINIMDVNTNMIFLMKMFNDYSTFMILIMILYLFILMIMVNKITNFNIGPLRKLN
uniref:NADH dehydrogenase subunit 6 n=1 Tax=Dolophilodes bellatulus TaxID=2682779 RepID=UPI0022DCDA2C|nr:NADH dehydrogenase subunit 6 [Dolophilodes bellatulus]UZZ43893.1 NADH dehydrogenase subunit 6 [Dolophilodes bellatulus]